MIQLSDIRKKSDANAPAAKSAGRASATNASEKVQTGYEVLYGRRNSSVHVPLSLPKEDTSYPSTGSALLDSFVSQAIAEPIALQHLRLVNVANRQPVPLATNRPATNKTSRKAQTATTLPTPPTALPTPPTAARPSSDTAAKHTTQTAISQAPSAPLFTPAVKVTPLSKSPAKSPTAVPVGPTTSQPSIPATSVVPATNKQSIQPATPAVEKLAAEKSAKPNAARALSERPPAAAEPEQIQPISHQTALKHKTPPATTPTLRKPSPPATAPTLSAAPAIAPIFEDGRTARDSAAAVGLIDINDTLLFGGDHENLASTDPFVSENNPSDNDAGVLAYISQQISAFTVSKLKAGFPNNTDPRVINRPDPPKHKTVLDIHTFKLSQLDGEGPTVQRDRPLTAISGQAQSSAPEINVLSKQVSALNQKIAELSQQLAQVTKAQASQ